MKMLTQVNEQLDAYGAAFKKAREFVKDDQLAFQIVEQVAKDRRTEAINAERNGSGNGFSNGFQSAGAFDGEKPASEKQKSFMKRLGLKVPDGLTSREASRLIDEELGKEGQ